MEELNMNKQELKLTVTTFISVNHYMNYRVIKKGKFNTVMPYKPKETLDFEKDFGKYVKSEIINQGWVKPNKDRFIILNTTFYMPRIDMDAQNYFKSMCDIMTDCGVWEDDNIVMEHVNGIYYDSENSRIEVSVTISERIGIFDSQCELDEFTQTCENCKRYKNNCSILKKSKEARIQKEVTFDKELKKWTCSKSSAIGGAR
jgi:Holliday junction resolvase RusA-like endonuclease